MIATALGAGLLLRLWFISHAANIGGDTFIYGDIAKTWIAHGIYGFSRESGPPIPTLIRLPGYPLFLAFCFLVFGSEHYGAVLYAQVALDLFTCLVVAALAGQLFGRRAFYATLWLAVLCPFTASYAAAGLAETLTLTSIALAFYALLRWQQASQPESGEVVTASPYNRWLYLLGATLAYSIVLRPEQGLLAAAILSAILWLRMRKAADDQTGLCRSLLRIRFKTAAPVLLTAFLALLPLAPWTVRNWRTFHVFQSLAPRYATDPGEAIPLGFYRWFRTWGIDFASTEDAYWNYNGAPIAISDLPNRAFDNDSQYARTDALLSEYNQKAIATSAFDARFAALAVERIHASPMRYYVALPVARLVNMLLRPRVEMFPIQVEWWKFSEHPRQTIFSAAYAALNLAYLAFAAIGLRRWYRRTLALPPTNSLRAPALALIASTLTFFVLRCVLLLTVDNSEPRYTLEFFPVLILWWAALFPPRSRST
jgi:hypothetical protein